VIRAVSEQPLPLPPGGVEIDGRGKHVYPGLVLALSRLGLTEVDAVDMTLDFNEAGGITPEVAAWTAVNPDSTLIPVTRRNGVLVAGTVPAGGLVPGRLSVLQLDGWTNEDLALERDAGLVVDWPGLDATETADWRGVDPDDLSEAQQALRRIDELFEQAAAYGAARAADPALTTDLRLDALQPVLAGDEPVFLQADSQPQIDSGVRWAVARGLRPVLVGGRDALACAELLRAHDVPVVLTGSFGQPPRRDDSYATNWRRPAELEAAGLRWSMCMGAGEASNARNLPYEVAACLPHGLDEEAALRAITLAPAEALGVADRVGSLEVGKHATLLLSDGSPLDLASRIEAAWIGGRRLELVDKQSALDAKYREKYRQLGLLPEDA
jgi:imidazolonepropionase-like amidohydrolase